MKARIDYTNVPEALRGMYQLEHYIHNSGLEESLVHLVKMRASQIRRSPQRSANPRLVTEGSRAGSRAVRMAGRAKRKYPHCPTLSGPYGSR